MNDDTRLITDGMFEGVPQSFTGRPNSEAMERVLAAGPFPVLDHGFIRLVDYMGTEDSILRAARTSYQRGTKSRREDRGLLRYLMRKRHTTPFEMCEVAVHAKMPLFVARQWVRHRMASINEMSARYSILDKEFYIPTVEALAPQSTSNKQGREGLLTERQAAHVRALMVEDAERAYLHYEVLLADRPDSDAFAAVAEGLDAIGETGSAYPAAQLADDDTFPGIARELARIGLSLNFYTQWVWKSDTKNFMDFLSLRNDPHAQYEIRVYAEVAEAWLAQWMPLVYEAFVDYRRDAETLSGPVMEALRELLEPVASDPDRLNAFRHRLGLRLEKREMEEAFKALGFRF